VLEVVSSDKGYPIKIRFFDLRHQTVMDRPTGNDETKAIVLHPDGVLIRCCHLRGASW